MAKIPKPMTPRVRLGYFKENSRLTEPPSEWLNKNALREPVASITAMMSSMRSSMVEYSSVRSERPVPLLSNRISLENRLSRVRKAASLGSAHIMSMLETQPGM